MYLLLYLEGESTLLFILAAYSADRAVGIRGLDANGSVSSSRISADIF